jgi:hypothetical protein
MINIKDPYYMLQYADSPGVYVFVDTKTGGPTRSSNPNRLTFWQEQSHALKYAEIFSQYKFMLIGIQFDLFEVIS